MTVTETYPNYHPEYIMAMRFYGSPETESTAYPTAFKAIYKIKTRLSRRLQTGDSIQFLLIGFNQVIPLQNSFLMELSDGGLKPIKLNSCNI